MSADLHTLTGAYAAHALSDTERLAFERHLDACPACAQGVLELTETAARLGAAVAAPPPPDLWDRVRAEALATRQLAPVVGRADRRRRARQGGARAGLLAGRRRFPPLLAAAAALLVAVLSVTALNLGLLGRSDRSERTADLVAAVLAAPDARRVAASPGGAGQATVVVSRGRGQAVFVASGLPPAPAARTYQLWVVGRSGPRPAGLVEVAGGGRVTRLLDGPVTGDEQVAMTVERRGGAAQPTSEPVVVVDLQA
jgi:anti-sigma factor RsiW